MNSFSGMLFKIVHGFCLELPICGVTGKVEASTYFTGNLRHLSSEDVLIFRAR